MPDDLDIQRLRERAALMGYLATLPLRLGGEGRAAVLAARDFDQAMKRLWSMGGVSPTAVTKIRVGLLAMAPGTGDEVDA